MFSGVLDFFLGPIEREKKTKVPWKGWGMMPVWKNEVPAGSIQFPPLKAMWWDFDATLKKPSKSCSLYKPVGRFPVSRKCLDQQTRTMNVLDISP